MCGAEGCYVQRMIASLLLLTALAGAPEMKVLHSSRDSAVSQGTGGPVLVIRSCTVK